MRILKINDHNVSIVAKDLILNGENNNLTHYTFLHHDQIFYFKNGIWLQDEYLDEIYNKSVFFLNQYSLNDFSIVESIQLPDDFDEIFTFSLTNNSIWISTSSGFYQISWDGQVQGELKFEKNFFFDIFMSQNNFLIFTVDDENVVILIKSSINSFSNVLYYNVLPLNSILRPFLWSNFIIWLSMTCLSLLGLIFIGQKKFKIINLK
ncbi:MAG: hypothetical protein HeimC3_34880 [Candidatus Heimdallarchaeota archaeon LC_3]|nr:MAG: hypothetical protein HeimC3_34880 [Candidatus Heimdallarchaeota archaeon LC_3]